jgi:hypothetical protein
MNRSRYSGSLYRVQLRPMSLVVIIGLFDNKIELEMDENR